MDIDPRKLEKIPKRFAAFARGETNDIKTKGRFDQFYKFYFEHEAQADKNRTSMSEPVILIELELLDIVRKARKATNRRQFNSQTERLRFVEKKLQNKFGTKQKAYLNRQYALTKDLLRKERFTIVDEVLREARKKADTARHQTYQKFADFSEARKLRREEESQNKKVRDAERQSRRETDREAKKQSDSANQEDQKQEKKIQAETSKRTTGRKRRATGKMFAGVGGITSRAVTGGARIVGRDFIDPLIYSQIGDDLALSTLYNLTKGAIGGSINIASSMAGKGLSAFGNRSRNRGTTSARTSSSTRETPRSEGKQFFSTDEKGNSSGVFYMKPEESVGGKTSKGKRGAVQDELAKQTVVLNKIERNTNKVADAEVQGRADKRRAEGAKEEEENEKGDSRFKRASEGVGKVFKKSKEGLSGILTFAAGIIFDKFVPGLNKLKAILPAVAAGILLFGNKLLRMSKMALGAGVLIAEGLQLLSAFKNREKHAKEYGSSKTSAVISDTLHGIADPIYKFLGLEDWVGNKADSARRLDSIGRSSKNVGKKFLGTMKHMPIVGGLFSPLDYYANRRSPELQNSDKMVKNEEEISSLKLSLQKMDPRDEASKRQEKRIRDLQEENAQLINKALKKGWDVSAMMYGMTKNSVAGLAPSNDSYSKPSNIRSQRRKDIIHDRRSRMRSSNVVRSANNFKGLGGSGMSMVKSEMPGISAEEHRWIQNYSRQYNVDPALVYAVIKQESAGKSGATSSTGVKGLMQVTGGLARSYGLDRDDPEQQIHAGVRYLSELSSRYKGDLNAMMAEYNGGFDYADRAKSGRNYTIDPRKDRENDQHYAGISKNLDRYKENTNMVMSTEKGPSSQQDQIAQLGQQTELQDTRSAKKEKVAMKSMTNNTASSSVMNNYNTSMVQPSLRHTENSFVREQEKVWGLI